MKWHFDASFILRDEADNRVVDLGELSSPWTYPACLIAAAPELLDVLRAFFTEWDATNHDSAFAGYDVVRNHEDALRAAIAKAEGHL